MSGTDSTVSKRRKRRRTITTEIRRLQKTEALLRCMQVAACEETEVDWDDALRVICNRVAKSLRGLDRLEVAMSMEEDHDA